MAAEDEGLPTRDRCDLSDPEEMFLWAMIGLAEVHGAQVLVSFDHLRAQSAQLEGAGAMLQCPSCGYEKSPRIKYQAPAVPPMTPYGDQGSWVSADSPEVESDPLGAVLARIGPDVKRQVAARLQDENPEWFKEDTDG